jgi:hypothetical protein
MAGISFVLGAALRPCSAHRVAGSNPMNALEMDPLDIVTDRCIRRGLGFAGLAIGMVMLSLSFDLPLALRCGADLVALTAGVMLVGAWQAPRRDMRHSEIWAILDQSRPEIVRGRPKQLVQEEMRSAMRRRLLWHAEQLAMVALALWTAMGIAWVMRLL